MKMSFNQAVAAVAALLTVGFVSCSKSGNGGGGETPAGSPTRFTLAIGQPTTYAADNDNATADELKFNSVDVFIYDASSYVQVTHKNLTLADFGTPTNNVYTATTKITTTTGPKLVYVGINLPDAIVNTIKAAGSTAGLSAVNTIAAEGDLNKSAGFAMFSSETVNADFVADEDDPANKVRVGVARMVAKVTVENKLTLPFSVAGGAISDLYFTLGNLNTKIYALQKKQGGYVVDPNWNEGGAPPAVPSYMNDFLHQAPIYGTANYAAVNTYVDGTKGKDLTPKYAPENTSLYYRKGETTYASVCGTFVPGSFSSETGVETPYSGSAKSFWTVRTTAGTKYFELEATADTYHAANAGSVKSDEYVNGICYYSMYLNPNNGFNTLRNGYYRTSITNILGLGNPNPGPDDREEPVDEETNMIIEVDILPWQVVSDEYELKP